jgi:osmotically-inducible protein OsmY
MRGEEGGLMQALILALILLLPACSPLSIVTNVGTRLGRAAMDERPANTIITDSSIRANIAHRFVQTDVNDLFPNVETEVHEGRVLFTGNVDSPETSIIATRIAWEVPGVKEVMNNTKVIAGPNPGNYVQDAMIANQVRARLLMEKGIQSVNYTNQVVDGVVYMMGIAQDEEELTRATEVVRRTLGVKKVISHVRLKQSSLRWGEASGQKSD